MKKKRTKWNSSAKKDGLGGVPDPASPLIFHENPGSRTGSSTISGIPFFLSRKIQKEIKEIEKTIQLHY